jgi:drug/metabolite transporter (DMT)-like permease
MTRAAPLVFVVLWASGFVVARLIRPYAEPESFVVVRFACSVVVLGLIAGAAGAPWPRTWRGWRDSLIAGALMQGLYVGCVFWAIKHGLPAAVAALISGLQPLLTGALAGPLLGERVSPRRWLGIVVGFAGAIFVLEPNLRGTAAVPTSAVLSCFGGMVAITLGTIWQKRIGGVTDLRSGAAIQFVGGLAVVLPLALATEHFAFVNARDLWIGLAWSVLVLSVTAALMLLTLIRRGAVARVTSLFYLVPPFTALMAMALFGETLVPIQFLGMAVAAVGVAIANKG